MNQLARLFAVLLAFVALTPGVAQADELRPGYIELAQQDAQNWSLSWKTPLPIPDPTMATVPPEIPAQCSFKGDPTLSMGAAAILGSASLTCDGPLAGGRIGMPGLVGNADVLVRLAPLDEEVQAYRLTAREPAITLAAEPEQGQVWRSYFVIGVEHILMGWDHLLFVIALLLLVVDFWRVVKAATAFTLAHSITLAAASLGFVGLPQAPVEALIALSIVFLAVEVARKGRHAPSIAEQWPWVVAFLFGLLHGFGFAGALNEIGLPEGEVPTALLSFNLGVEAGQIAVIAAVMLLREAVRRIRPAAVDPAVRLASYAIGITGAYWMFDRILT